MPLPDPILRDYKMDDLEMFERAQVFHGNYVIDEALFSAASPIFDLTYAADFQTEIDDADAIPSDYEVETYIVDVTNQIELKMVDARKALQKLYSYANLAFNNVIKLRNLGKDLYDKARDSHKGMKELLELAHRRASETDYETALTAVGFSAGDLAGLQILEGELDDLNKQQEDLMSQRRDKSQERIIAYNAVWAYMVQINQMSKVIFVDNPAKLTMYLLYPTSHSSLPKPQNPTAIVDVGNPTHAIVGCDTVVEATSYKLYFSEVTIGDTSGSFTYSTENATPSFDYPMTAGKRTYWKIRAFSASSSSDYSDEVYIDA